MWNRWQIAIAYGGVPVAATRVCRVLVLTGSLLLIAALGAGPQDLPSAPAVEGVEPKTTGMARVWFGQAPGAMASSFAEDEAQWLRSTQAPSGLFAQTPALIDAVPYFSNFAARALLTRDPGAARAYIHWYLDNLNLPDRWGLDGTVYDHRFEGGQELPRNTYDSADSYAATFLSLVGEYLRHTGDRKLVEAYFDRLSLVASVILKLQDGDGLVRAGPQDGIKYLMDNAECYRGLHDWADILAALDLHTEAKAVRHQAERIAEGIEARLWDRGRGAYAWGLGPKWLLRRSNLQMWYPDAVAQLYPILYGVVPPAGDRAQSLWQRFNAAHPGWTRLDKPDLFPWVLVAKVAVLVGDTERAETFLDMVRQRYITDLDRSHPWYAMESACFILAHDALTKSYAP